MHAKHNNITSNTINIEVVENPTPNPNSSIYINKVLVEDFTGIWCPFCTRILWAIEQVELQTDKVLVAAIHRGNPSGSYYDPWNLSAGETLENAFPSLIGIAFEGYPTALLNRSVEWSYPEHTNITHPISLIKENCKYGIAISSTLNTSDSGSVTIYFSFKENLPNARCVVYILEDDLKANQANGYGTLYGGANPIVNFNHKHVARGVVSSSILGENIPTDQSVAGSVYEMSFPVSSLSFSDIDKLTVMAVLLNSNGRVENVQIAPANSILDYELAE
ncbi:MAG: Omp28-related outer membrane protein [Prevotellaceae bacterium]|nr:Omp28-related outer membrane protein [Prevotellaceae bacterium]